METGEVSFTKQVKSELSARSYTTEEKKSLLSGFIRNGAVFSIGSKPSLELRTEIASVCKLIYSSLKDVYQRTPRITYEKKTRFKKGVIYRISVRDERLYDRREELEGFKDGIERIPPKNRLHRKNLSSFLIGCFLANGSVNNPSSAHTSYYLEMAFTDKNDALAVKKKLLTFKEEKSRGFKYIKRREKHVLYLKRSDQNSVFLSFIGANQGRFTFENARINKEERNINNRLSICDSANFSRSLNSAQRDIEAIEFLLTVRPLSLFDEKTQAVIQKRLDRKEANYRELAENISKDGVSISKSGVVHIRSSLRGQADEIRKRRK